MKKQINDLVREIDKCIALLSAQFNASINAQFRAGQMAGLFIDKREINVSGIEGMSRESLEKRLQELESKINENKKIIDITPEEIIEEQ